MRFSRSGLTQYLIVWLQRRAAVDQGHPRAVTEEVERRLRRRSCRRRRPPPTRRSAPTARDSAYGPRAAPRPGRRAATGSRSSRWRPPPRRARRALAPARPRLRTSERPALGPDRASPPRAARGRAGERARHRLVVGERLPPIRLLVGNGERHAGDLEPLAGGEEEHVGRIVDERRHQRPAVDEQDREPGAPRLGADGDPGRPGADDQQVERSRARRSRPRSARRQFPEVVDRARPGAERRGVREGAACR